MNKRAPRLPGIVSVLVWTSFVIYLFFVIKILFLDARYRFFYANMRYHVNLIPLKTVIGYIGKIANDEINTGTGIFNLLGNLLLLFPFGCYFPCLFAYMRSLPRFLLTVFVAVLCAELLQIGLCIGSFDVDDIILNVSGAMIGYGVIRIPFLNWLLRRIHVYKIQKATV